MYPAFPANFGGKTPRSRPIRGVEAKERDLAKECDLAPSIPLGSAEPSSGALGLAAWTAVPPDQIWTKSGCHACKTPPSLDERSTSELTKVK
eukprot:5822088-Pleurochrysis_carterae.AAC.2